MTDIEPIAVRQAVAADIAPLAVLFDLYRQFQGQTGNLAAAHAFLAERFDHGESTVFIATAGDAAVGFAQLYPSYSSVSLSRVFILNDLFDAESIHSIEPQREGWQAILDNFARHVERGR